MISIGFSSDNQIYSRLIRWATNSPVSHAFMLFDGYVATLPLGKPYQVAPMILQATSAGISDQPEVDFLRSEKIFAQINLFLPPAAEIRMRNFALSKLHDPYDYAAVMGFPWVLLNRKFGKEVVNPFHEKSAFFCSEFVLDACDAANVPEFAQLRNLTDNTTDPNRLLQAFKKLNLPQTFAKWVPAVSR